MRVWAIASMTIAAMALGGCGGQRSLFKASDVEKAFVDGGVPLYDFSIDRSAYTEYVDHDLSHPTVAVLVFSSLKLSRQNQERGYRYEVQGGGRTYRSSPRPFAIRRNVTVYVLSTASRSERAKIKKVIANLAAGGP